jgi:hypothetical protein
LGDRHKSNEGGGHQKIATTTNPKRDTEEGRYDGSTQPVHIESSKCGMPFYKLLRKADSF